MMRVFVRLALFFILVQSLQVSAGVTPMTTSATSSFACDELASYWNDVYQGTAPSLSQLEYEVISAAWNGTSEWTKMSASELTLASRFNADWSRALANASTDTIPQGLQEYHDLLTRDVELVHKGIDAHLKGDQAARDAASEERLDTLKRRYQVALTGVEQCGSVWVETFGEPWNPVGRFREMPYDTEQTGNVGDYELTVVEVIPDATDMVLRENQHNDPPEQGNVFFMVRVEVTYTGGETGNPASDLRFSVVGNQNRGYSESRADCGSIPDDAYDVPELFEGGSAEFNVCWSVPEEEVNSLVMYIEPGFSDEERVWFSLDIPSQETSTPES